MKRCFFVGLILALNLTLAAWTVAQGGRTDLFDQKKVDQELEIMKGILGTTLSYAARELLGSETAEGHAHEELIGRWGFSGISAFYLYGQGATFLIPTSSLRLPRRAGGGRLITAYGEPFEPRIAFEEASEAYEAALEELVEAKENLAEQSAELAVLKAQAVETAVTAPQPPAAAQAPQRRAEPKIKTKPTPEEMRKKIAQAQEQVKKRREYAEQQHQKFAAALAQVKVHLVEALANHGDSLTFVKPNEYINLVLATGGEPFGMGEGSSRSDRDIISVQKSAVSDYKAGRLTMDALKQKVLQYSN
jgi:hypothetical protein